MYISNVNVKNFRNFGEKGFSIDLKPFSLIVGENNVGKTNLLYSISLVLGESLSNINRRLEISDFNNKTIDDFYRKVNDLTKKVEDIVFPEISIKINFNDIKDVEHKIIFQNCFVDKKHTSAVLEYVFKPKNSLTSKWINQYRQNHIESIKPEMDYSLRLTKFPISDFEYKIYGGNSRNEKPLWEYFDRLEYVYLDALRNATRELSEGKYKTLYKFLSKRIGEIPKVNELLGEIDTEISSQKELSDIKKDLQSWFDKISNKKTGINFKLSSPELDYLLQKISLVYDDDSIPIVNNGLGSNNILFVSLILSQISDSKDFFKLFVIEEPESHLHPNLQNNFAKEIHISMINQEDKKYFRNRQLILSTHSSHISSTVDLNDIVVIFENDKEEVISEYIFDNIKDENIKFLQKYFDATKAKMIFSKKNILVEGISEQILIKTFFEILFDSTLYKENIELINVNGVAFKHFLEVFSNGFFKKTVVLTDGDKDTKFEDRSKNLKNKYESKTIKVFYNEYTFEKSLIEDNLKKLTNETFKESIIYKALSNTRPSLAKKITFSSTVKEWFELIEKYKADFAMNIHYLINEEQEIGSFVIPKYIVDGFKVLGYEREE
ncbi:AAA family ATPase [Candidatus Izimaplasma bacterium ZiA1]|uniref:ATP-dependent nuclease n=1 Tax=Candidatus Izimoplasma sp. ZiA1 TaxID=2024899 RepID=UPI00143B5527